MQAHKLRRSLDGADLIVLGNSAFVAEVDLAALSTRRVQIMGLNAAPCLEERLKRALDFHVLFDFRFLPLKARFVVPHLSEQTLCLWGEQVAFASEWVPKNRVVSIPFLGYEGFSYDLSLGCYSGHTVAHVALQAAYYMRPRRVFLLGVDLNYGATHPRFYQRVRGDDVELQVRRVQIAQVSHACRVLEAAGIAVTVIGPDSLLRGHVTALDYVDLLRRLDPMSLPDEGRLLCPKDLGT